jgi:secreted PhoX family phosphatase
MDRSLTRRDFMSASVRVAGGLGLSLLGNALVLSPVYAGGADDFGPLQPPDANGLQLPAGFSSRVVAISGQPVGGTGFRWHVKPDGGAVFVTDSGGWIYVSNSEEESGGGGVGAIEFDADANLVNAYSICTGTTRNCAGGPTPWGTWLTCEEEVNGQVYECNPYAPGNGILRAAMGTFRHEAAAVDPLHKCVYLTEDRPTGKLYRFRPTTYPDLSSGLLEVAQVAGGTIAPGEVRGLSWTTSVAAGSSFNGGEGCWYDGSGRVYFSTKGDSRVWRMDTTVSPETLEIFYDGDGALTQSDNVYAAGNGDVYVAEDAGNLEIVALTQSGAVHPIVRLTGRWGTEITGPALNPAGDRLYFSEQRSPGTTYEVKGPFQAAAVSGP